MPLGDAPLPPGTPQPRARRGIARTFQTPRVIGEASVLQNVMIGGTIEGHASFAEALLALPRHRRDERRSRPRRRAARRIVGLEALADVRADRLQHSELRFMEIARALMLRPGLPAARRTRRRPLRRRDHAPRGADQGDQRGAARGVLLVEHHADLIFDICDRVTVLNLGRDACRRNARRDPRTQGGRQCLPRRLNPCSTSPALECRLRQDRRAAWRRFPVAPGRDRRAARPQRRGQDDAAARVLGTAAGRPPGTCASAAAT